jgi:chitinase
MLRKNYPAYSVFAVFLFILFGCKKNADITDNYLDKPACINSFTPKASAYHVVGFYPSWNENTLSVTNIPWEKLTRIVYAFAIPYRDGTIFTSSLPNTTQLVDSAHAHGVEVYFSVGGGDGSTNFPWIASNEKSRTRFVKEVRQYLFENCLDGVDIDWEYWTGYANNIIMPSESNAFISILKALKSGLDPFGLGISVDLGGSDWGGKHFFDEVTLYADYLQVMCYDFSGPWSAPGPHSAFEDAIGSGSNINSTGLAYWVNYRGWPKEHILLGVPFYGRDFDNQGGTGVTYSDIIKLSRDAYTNDRVNNIYYDGITTMARKTQYVVDNGFSGIMIWEITQDSNIDSTSLLDAIDRVINP